MGFGIGTNSVLQMTNDQVGVVKERKVGVKKKSTPSHPFLRNNLLKKLKFGKRSLVG